MNEPAYLIGIDHGAGPDIAAATLLRRTADGRLLIVDSAHREPAAIEDPAWWHAAFGMPPTVEMEDPLFALARLEREQGRPMAGEGPRGVLGLMAGEVRDGE